MIFINAQTKGIPNTTAFEGDKNLFIQRLRQIMSLQSMYDLHADGGMLKVLEQVQHAMKLIELSEDIAAKNAADDQEVTPESIKNKTQRQRTKQIHTT